MPILTEIANALIRISPTQASDADYVRQLILSGAKLVSLINIPLPVSVTALLILSICLSGKIKAAALMLDIQGGQKKLAAIKIHH